MLVPARLGLRRTGRTHYRPQLQPHLWPYVLRAGPDGSPRPPPSHGPALHTPGQKWGQRDPRAPSPTARASFNFASFEAVMKDAHGPSHKSCYL